MTKPPRVFVRLLTAALFVCGCLMLAPTSLAQERAEQTPQADKESPAPDTAEPQAAAIDPVERYEAGKAALIAGKLEDAYAAFEEGLKAPETDPLHTWNLLLGAALACEKLERGPAAIEYYQRFLKHTDAMAEMLPPKWKAKREVVAEAVEEFQQRLLEAYGYVTLTSQPEGAEVYIDGARAGVDKNLTTPTALYLKPGDYVVEVRREGFEPGSESISLTKGQLRPLSFTLDKVKIATPAPQAAAEPAEPTVIVQQVTTQPAPYEWALVGVGGALTLGGVACTVLAAMTHSSAEQIDIDQKKFDTLRADQKLFEGLQWVGYGLGAALIGTGLIIHFVAQETATDAPDPKDALGMFTTPKVALGPTRGGTYGSLTWEF